MTIIDFIFPAVAALTFSFGLFVFLRPRRVIDMQIRFYALINWKIEPISWGKELRNTRFMGLSLVVLVILSFLFLGLFG